MFFELYFSWQDFSLLFIHFAATIISDDFLIERTDGIFLFFHSFIPTDRSYHFLKKKKNVRPVRSWNEKKCVGFDFEF